MEEHLPPRSKVAHIGSSPQHTGHQMVGREVSRVSAAVIFQA